MNAKNDHAAWLHGGNAVCSVPGADQPCPRRFVLLGAPGVGKGTQAELLNRHFGACHLSLGDVFRAAGKCGHDPLSPAMSHALEFMRQGQLVPDQTVVTLIMERLKCLRCGGGFLLDGFPRTVAQARVLAAILENNSLQLDAVLDYKLPLREIISRLSGRRTCPSCAAVFHLKSLPPKKPAICDHCGAALLQREDDRPESIRMRLRAYAKNAEPLKRFYRRRELLVSIEAAGTPEETFERSLQALARRPALDRPEILFA